MSKIAWRDLVRGTASILLAAGLAAPVLADEAGEPGAVDTAQSESPDTFVLSDKLNLRHIAPSPQAHTNANFPGPQLPHTRRLSFGRGPPEVPDVKTKIGPAVNVY